MRLLVTLVFVGCGRIAFDPTRTDAVAAGDGTAPMATCEQAWLDGPTLTAPAPLTAVNHAANDLCPVLSPDRLTLYFASQRAGPYEIHTATRATPSAPFGAAQRLPGLDTTSDETQLALSTDGLEAILTADNDVFRATRTATTAPWNPFTSMPGISSAQVEYNAVLSPDDRQLLFASIDRPGGAGKHDVWISTRADRDAPFSAPVPLTSVNTADDEASPSLLAGGRVIVFTALRDGMPADIWYATRASAADPFGTPRPVPGINTARQDFTPYLRSDGCELLFSRADAATQQDLYVATVLP